MLLTKAYLGATEITKAYLGSTVVLEPVVAGLLLDIYPSALMAFSLESLSSSYSGDVILARRSTDSAELGFTATEVSNGTLLSWASGGDVFVKTWYDQSGNANNATQATLGSQPRIIASGIFEPFGITGTGSSVLNVSGISVSATTTFSSIRTPSTPTGNQAVYQLGALNQTSSVFNSSSLFYSRIGVAEDLTTTTPSANTNYLVTANTTTSRTFRINGAEVASGSNITPTTGTEAHLFSLSSSKTYATNYSIAEMVVYPSDQSANYSGIESNINSRYSIY